MAKVMISMPEDLLRLLDEAAAAREQSRSRFIRDAVRERLAKGDVDERREALESLRQSFRDASWAGPPEDYIRRDRDR